jgi:hypothetical protein
MDAESIAERFHIAYEMLASSYGYRTRPESRVAWEDVPVANKNLMVATVQALLDVDIIRPGT